MVFLLAERAGSTSHRTFALGAPFTPPARTCSSAVVDSYDARMAVSAEGLRLRPLSLEDAHEATVAQRELAADDFAFLLGWDAETPWDEYLAFLRAERRGADDRPGRVPATFLVAQVGPELVGRVSIRHRLNAYLADVGGHVGYAVRPAHRGLGYGTEILRQALIIARAEGVDRVLVTCDAANAASAATIARAGGVLEDVRRDEDGRPTRRYWIE
jgi:predicted acetyltransferase